jgi:hypothetical protein
VVQELPTLPEHLSSPHISVFSGVRVTRYYMHLKAFFSLPEEFEDTKGVNRIRKSKDRQQKKMDKHRSTKHPHKTKGKNMTMEKDKRSSGNIKY